MCVARICGLVRKYTNNYFHVWVARVFITLGAVGRRASFQRGRRPCPGKCRLPVADFRFRWRSQQAVRRSGQTQAVLRQGPNPASASCPAWSGIERSGWHQAFRSEATPGKMSFFRCKSDLPDFPWYNIPKWGKYTKVTIKYTKWPKYTNIYHCKYLQNLPKLEFGVWKYAIWQTWCKCVSSDRYVALIIPTGSQTRIALL
jgi:hypothetical protein